MRHYEQLERVVRRKASFLTSGPSSGPRENILAMRLCNKKFKDDLPSSENGFCKIHFLITREHSDAS